MKTRHNAYDFLIVGAGLFGATFANIASEAGRKCLVVDRRNQVAGNCHTEEIKGIQVHMYGPHVFHTSDKEVWDYVNRFASFNRFVNSPLARFGDELYNLPFNMNTFYRLWGTVTPAQARAKIEEQKKRYEKPMNLEEQALSLVGREMYEKLVKGYTEKHWGKPCRELPASIIKRLPLRYTYDNNYYDDTYQGIPIGGYTKMFKRMLEGSRVILGTDYFEFIEKQPDIANVTVFTGPIDEFFGFRFGPLEYRSLHFETQCLDMDEFQGCAVVNYTSADVPYTRIVEHKHFEFGKQCGTVVTHEYPIDWNPGKEPYYPIHNVENNSLYGKYKTLADGLSNIHFGGRLGRYEYLDMDKVVRQAMDIAGKLLY